ncbi:MAG: ribonuclease III domain-containing protein, partial [Acidimicrobiales bacterium]
MVTTRDVVAARLGLDPASPLLTTALTHSSYAAEHDVESNERLEFLGDAVVDLAIADLIVTRHPELNEGSGSLVRSRVVNEAALANAARSLDLGAVMRVGRGVKKEMGTERPSLLADAFEAVVAALYFERGYDAAKEFVHEALASDVVAAALAPSDVDPKTRLRQWAEAHGLG